MRVIKHWVNLKCSKRLKVMEALKVLLFHCLIFQNWSNHNLNRSRNQLVSLFNPTNSNLQRLIKELLFSRTSLNKNIHYPCNPHQRLLASNWTLKLLKKLKMQMPLLWVIMRNLCQSSMSTRSPGERPQKRKSAFELSAWFMCVFSSLSFRNLHLPSVRA